MARKGTLFIHRLINRRNILRIVSNGSRKINLYLPICTKI
ncbi:hypothetical protein HMPREF9136_1391 [Prevotella dentalis DSM 3688]|uniref:Uncharacterized protein n=1 Tax=Prevotella dentalis (strain ATCC 49559 / DSM 3688 / JCM 13448 / NCTC 12043 / ES 2772) TaxID=908937 RepID=F9D3G3_PREDD|nr:hypothetical protein HMPREF9136_1391 [Prevotella dentalis DSM 3688]